MWQEGGRARRVTCAVGGGAGEPAEGAGRNQFLKEGEQAPKLNV